MSRQLPPYPSGDLRQWATQLVEYLQNRDGVESEVIPAPVALSHRIGQERALQDGVLMYNPELGRAELTVSGEWLPIAHDVAVAFTNQINGLVLTDPYQPLVFQSPLPPLPAGTYSVSIQLRVTGTGGAAFFQLRITEGGTPVAEGVENSLENGEVAYVPIPFIVSTTSGDLALEARGNNATIETGVVTITRIGQP